MVTWGSQNVDAVLSGYCIHRLRDGKHFVKSHQLKSREGTDCLKVMEVVQVLIPSFHSLMTGPRFCVFNHLTYIQELRKQDSERTNKPKPTAMNSLQRTDGDQANEILRQPLENLQEMLLSVIRKKVERKQGNKQSYSL